MQTFVHDSGRSRTDGHPPHDATTGILSFFFQFWYLIYPQHCVKNGWRNIGYIGPQRTPLHELVKFGYVPKEVSVSLVWR
jgi:hypothetical protein